MAFLDDYEGVERTTAHESMERMIERCRQSPEPWKRAIARRAQNIEHMKAQPGHDPVVLAHMIEKQTTCEEVLRRALAVLVLAVLAVLGVAGCSVATSTDDAARFFAPLDLATPPPRDLASSSIDLGNADLTPPPTLAICQAPADMQLALLARCAWPDGTAKETITGVTCNVCRDYAGCDAVAQDTYCVDLQLGCTDPTCGYHAPAQ